MISPWNLAMKGLSLSCRNLDLALRIPSVSSGQILLGQQQHATAVETAATAASATAALAALDGMRGVAAAVDGSDAHGKGHSDPNAEDAAAEWPVLALARCAEDMEVRGMEACYTEP